jgi:hypothetical protein
LFTELGFAVYWLKSQLSCQRLPFRLLTKPPVNLWKNIHAWPENGQMLSPEGRPGGWHDFFADIYSSFLKKGMIESNLRTYP